MVLTPRTYGVHAPPYVRSMNIITDDEEFNL